MPSSRQGLAPSSGTTVWSIVCAGLVMLAFSRTTRAESSETREAPLDRFSDRIELPELLTFAEAAYPELALRADLEATVTLELTIDRAGDVVSARVTQPVGHGFDEAASAAALKFKFRPAQRNGLAVPSKILYRYRFRLQKVVAAPPKLATMTGRVLVGGTSAPLSGATVEIRDAAGQGRQLHADAQGRWMAKDLAPGKYLVRLSAPGYVSVESTEQVAAGERLALNRHLAVPVESQSELEVVVAGDRPNRDTTRRTLERRELGHVPGTMGDALRALQNLPGVARGPAMSGQLPVRGLPSGSTLVYVDGTWVPLVFHLGGLSAVVPTESIDHIDFYPGNYGVRYGRGLGGVVDVGLRQPNPDGKYRGLVQADFIDVRALAEGPVPGLKRWQFLAAARRSHVDAWINDVMPQGGDATRIAPIYYDYQGFFFYRPSAQSSLRLGIFGSSDHVSVKNFDPEDRWRFDMRTEFSNVQALYRTTWSSALTRMPCASWRCGPRRPRRLREARWTWSCWSGTAFGVPDRPPSLRSRASSGWGSATIPRPAMRPTAFRCSSR